MHKSPKNLVLLGIGHTNAHIVKCWAQDPIPGYSLICISKFPDATYSGLLPGVLGGQFTEQAMRIELSPLVERARASLILSEVLGLDLESRTIQFADREALHFDMLSIGVGSMPAGWEQHAQSPLLVTIKPMQTFLPRLDRQLESLPAVADEPLRIMIVGGGVASVEIACCLQQQWKRRVSSRLAAIQIYTSSESVAEGMRARSRRRIAQLLQQRGIETHTGQRVCEVGTDDITTQDGRRHRADCVIWATGAAAPPVLARLGLETDERGFVATRPSLQSYSDPRIFAVGDAGSILESPAPKAGVYAVRQSPILWHNLRALADQRPLRSYRPQGDFLKLLNTGDGKALAEYRFLTLHAAWCLRLKNWIDRRFVEEFQFNNRRS